MFHSNFFVFASAHDVVRHAPGKTGPHTTWQQSFHLADCDAELEKLFHPHLLACPMIAVLVEAGIEEGHSTSTGPLEGIGKLIEKCFDLLPVPLKSLGMKPDGPDDPLSDDTIACVFPVAKKTVPENLFNSFGVELHFRLGHHARLLCVLKLNLTIFIIL
jgi:hypothetical protein